METQTRSEYLFHQFCQQHKIVCERVPVGDTRRPDFDIIIADEKIVVEVKQLDPSPDEVRQQREIKLGRLASSVQTPGERIRKAIDSGAKQISNRAKGKYSSLLVIYNNVPFAEHKHTDAYSVLVGMYGLETLVVNVPADKTSEPRLLHVRHGPRQKMTPARNTSVSAVGILKEINGVVSIDIYHNAYAALALSPSLLRSCFARQFSYGSGDHFGWEEVRP